ncbi:MAG: RNA polymerase sigma-70 factor [Bacteroidia bacterium]|nr:RNA polymerase sigma-70 factor [Bacteroidia bacterium]
MFPQIKSSGIKNRTYNKGRLGVFVNNSVNFAPSLNASTTDTDLYIEVKAGSGTAFETLFKRYYSTLCSYAGKIIKNSDASEEIVQDCFVKLWEKRANINIDSSVKSYLYRSVHNACLNGIKHEAIKDTYKNLQAQHYSSSFAFATDALHASELQTSIQKAIDTLPPQCKTIFTMSRFEELSYREIAEILNLSIKTIENQMGKALKIMRLQLAGYLNLFILITLLF